MKIKVLKNRRDEILKRNEIIFTVHHDNSPTPSRVEVRREIASMFKVDIERVYIRRMEGVTGTNMTIGEAHIYDSPEYAKAIEPKHIILRHSPLSKEKE
ncbi:30S ribosomal protein S24e [Candidatus Bathyarchaeota archaeon]|nr:30S ribosomal protein S24e [Candidatus Bathyarchaeota archaeon]